jgi:HSP20 family protein|tara:strand:+ start:63 stop:410 length:348 start_codon:yes stop_codon:yes gene_type:complete
MILTNQAWNLVDELIKRNHFNPKTNTNSNMKLEDDVLTMEFDVPGLSKKDISIRVEDSVLLIEGDNEDRTFNKSYKISEDWNVSKTSASVKDGVLKISIPKIEEKKAKVIDVTVS